MGVMAFLNRLRPLRANATLLTDGPELGLESQSGKSWHGLSGSRVCNICVFMRPTTSYSYLLPEIISRIFSRIDSVRFVVLKRMAILYSFLKFSIRNKIQTNIIDVLFPRFYNKYLYNEIKYVNKAHGLCLYKPT